jgi:ABC-type transport system involved in multi-copper enzyme maturation permease subunit
MNELALLLVWIFSIAISMGVSNRLMPPEFESRTIYPLLAKPVSRGTVLLGKYLGAVTASLSALALFYLGYALLAGFREQFWFPVVLIQAFILHASFVLLLCALSILGSLALTPSANWTLTALVTVSMLLFGSRLPAYAASQGAPVRQILQAIDLFAPHFDFFDMRLRVVHHWSGISWGMCAFVVCYALVYSALCLFIASRLFRRKAI